MNVASERNAQRRWRQARWLLWYFLSKYDCAFCGKPLIKDFDEMRVNVTLHHLKGSQETDDMDQPCPVEWLRPAHADCHKRYHVRKKMIEMGNAGVSVTEFFAECENLERTCEFLTPEQKKELDIWPRNSPKGRKDP